MTSEHQTNYARAVRACLVDEYGIDDPRFFHGGNHPRVEFTHLGKTIKLTLQREGGGRELGASTIEMKLRDIRRVLGPPTVSEKPCQPRKLEDMLPVIRPAAAQASIVTDQGAPQEGPVLVGSVALYSANKSLRISLSPEAYAAFNAGYSGPPGVVVGFTAPDTWTLRHGPADRPVLKKIGPTYLLSIGGFSTWEKLGAFAATSATVRLVGGTLMVKLSEAPRRKQESKLNPTITFERDDSIWKIKPRLDQPPKEIPAKNDALRAALTEIARLEATTPYRLVRIKDSRAWVWRVPDITLDDMEK